MHILSNLTFITASAEAPRATNSYVQNKDRKSYLAPLTNVSVHFLAFVEVKVIKCKGNHAKIRHYILRIKQALQSYYMLYTKTLGKQNA